MIIIDYYLIYFSHVNGEDANYY